MATIITTGIVTPPLTDTTVSAAMPVGTKVSLTDGGEAIYVQAASTVAQFDSLSLLADNTVKPLTTAFAVASKRVAFADTTSIASASYGWVKLSGRPKVKLLVNCADEVTLFTTATAGELDDATVSASQVLGVTSTVTISNATAVTCIVPNGAMIAVFSGSPGA